MKVETVISFIDDEISTMEFKAPSTDAKEFKDSKDKKKSESKEKPEAKDIPVAPKNSTVKNIIEVPIV